MNSKMSSDGEQYFSAEDYSSKATKSSDSFLSAVSTRWKSIIDKEDEDLIEDEKIPILDMNETSPGRKLKTFRDSTVFESHWMHKISDDSFEALEQLVKSPSRDTMANDRKGNNLSAIQEVNSDCSKAFESISENESNTETSEENYLTSSSQVSSSNECNKQIHGNISLSSLLDSLDNVKDNSDEKSQASNSHSSKEIVLDESIKFNDTLEEMDYILNHGMNFRFKKPEPESFINDSLHSKPEAESLTPIVNLNDKLLDTPKANSASKKTFFFEGSPYDKENCKEIKTKKNFFYSPLPAKPKSALSTNNNYDNIMSPIKYFMENSPVVPKIQNVRPTKPIMEKHYPALDQTNLIDLKKEATPSLPQTNYKCPTVTHVINKDTPTKLPKNGQVANMVENLPKTCTIKHEHREKIQSPMGKYPFAINSGNVNDENDVNISVHIKTPAVRTNTLK